MTRKKLAFAGITVAALALVAAAARPGKAYSATPAGTQDLTYQKAFKTTSYMVALAGGESVSYGAFSVLIPAGQRFVYENISVRATLPVGISPPIVSVMGHSPVLTDRGRISNSEDLWTSDMSLKDYTDTSYVSISSIYGETLPARATVDVIITGYLIPSY